MYIEPGVWDVGVQELWVKLLVFAGLGIGIWGFGVSDLGGKDLGVGGLGFGG